MGSQGAAAAAAAAPVAPGTRSSSWLRGLLLVVVAGFVLAVGPGQLFGVGSSISPGAATLGGRTALEPSLLRPRPSGGGKAPAPVSPPRGLGLVVAVAGLPRTGSTALYNMLRLIMFDRDPNLVTLFVSGQAFSTGHNRTHIEICRQHGIPTLVKLHEPAVLAELVRAGLLDVVLFSHRDPADMLCSMARAFNPKMLANTPQQWVAACHRNLALQVQLYRAVAPRRSGPGGAAPTGVESDMAFFPGDLEAEFRRLALLLGLDQPDHATAARLVTSFQRVSSANLPNSWRLPGWPHHPGTMMHAGHQGSDPTGGRPHRACAARPALQLDPVCVAWQTVNGSAPAAVLRNPADVRLMPGGDGGGKGAGGAVHTVKLPPSQVVKDVDIGPLAGPELW